METTTPPYRSHLPATAPASGLSITSLVLGLLGFCVPIVSIVAIVCGHLGLRAAKRSGGAVGGRGLALAGTVIGYVSGALWLVFFSFIGAGIGAGVLKAKQARELFPVSKTPVPVFPALTVYETLEPSKVRVAQIDLPQGAGSQPGSAMSFRVYLPAGDAAPRSLPCVLIAPAGTNLLSGASIDELNEDAYHDEALPYAEAGMAVVWYSIDGENDDIDGSDEEMKKAFKIFGDSAAGVINGRNAFEFALARLPAVDPGRIYSAGHSSAGTLSLLLAAHEPRLKGCVAYAPAVDIEAHFSEALSTPLIELTLPGLGVFARRSSPLTHAARIGVPVFLFFAEDDELVTPDSARPFIEKLRAGNPAVTVKTVPDGGHYDSMIEEGIPAGIEWMQKGGR